MWEGNSKLPIIHTEVTEDRAPVYLGTYICRQLPLFLT